MTKINFTGKDAGMIIIAVKETQKIGKNSLKLRKNNVNVSESIFNRMVKSCSDGILFIIRNHINILI
ncbi:MAG: lactate/malate family dehydrogenase [cyanobacterium endosymbiont of Rhopalodia inflata]